MTKMGKVFVSPSPQAPALNIPIDDQRSKSQTRASQFDIYSPGSRGNTTPTGFSAENVLLGLMGDQIIPELQHVDSSTFRARFNPSESLVFRDAMKTVSNGAGFTISNFSKH